MDPWWSEQCTGRGPGLSHTADGTTYCIHCRMTPRRSTLQSSIILPQADIDARMRTLGLTAGEPAVENPTELPDVSHILLPGVVPPPSEDIPVEPRAISGDGPVGNRWAVGRGEPTARFLRHVRAYVDFHTLAGFEQ